MFKNEKGAVLPVTLVVATVLIVFTFYGVEKFKIEKMFYKDVENGLVLDHLLLLAIHEVPSLVVDDHMNEGVLHYLNGTVEYVVISREERYLSIKLSVLTTQDLIRKVTILYDKQEAKILEWVEVFT
ncbi:competence type IV pilus minor pilin ComGG [Bacillus cihuensis]|uniref:competence type IV pilus minor pilin ComGG n=1 Tax=Bacillus cihuensis TaxID=1208599 RepID=UPI000415A707|nr:competence type IV pilus minor pilin ComGG [Bacillus cihuensis]